ncbi:hypothetical protein LIA77_03214 [Sarocladium implicatum]|nr:hypothetical protein LIA77_03214 [Sarocladium implicatum]
MVVNGNPRSNSRACVICRPGTGSCQARVAGFGVQAFRVHHQPQAFVSTVCHRSERIRLSWLVDRDSHTLFVNNSPTPAQKAWPAEKLLSVDPRASSIRSSGPLLRQSGASENEVMQLSRTEKR